MIFPSKALLQKGLRSQQQLAREDELQQARWTVRLLEEGQVGSGAPSFTPALATPLQLGLAAACPVFASPSPATPHACLHPNMQYVPPQSCPMID